MVTSAAFARVSQFDDRCTRVLCGEGFVEQLDGNLSLFAQGFGKFGGAATGEIGIPVFVEGLTDDNETRFVFGGEVCHLRRVQQAGDMLDDGQWTGEGPGRVTERKTDPLFAVVNC